MKSIFCRTSIATNELYLCGIPMMGICEANFGGGQVMLGKVVELARVHEERIIIVVIHNALNLLLQFPHSLQQGVVASCFDCVPTAFSVLYYCFLRED